MAGDQQGGMQADKEDKGLPRRNYLLRPAVRVGEAEGGENDKGAKAKVQTKSAE